MKKTLILLIAGAFVVFSACQPKTNPEITVEDLKASLSYLASDSLEGRLPGSAGGLKAGYYIAQQFQTYGLEQAGETGYFQNFSVITETEAPVDANSLKVGEFSAELNKDFIPFTYSTDGSLKAKVAFVGYGFDIDMDSLKWNDYEGMNVEGKWLIVLRNDPEIRNPNSLFIPYSGEKSKVVTANEKGASGILLVAGPGVSRSDQLVELEIDQTESKFGIPAFNITREFANKILESTGKTIADLEEGLIKNMEPNSFQIDVEVDGTSKIVTHKSDTRNVIALIEGSDPELKDEYVVIGAHYDHLGWGGVNSSSREPDTTAIHYGADDNASGTSGLLEIADKLKNTDLKRSVLLIAFGAEEIGLIGSKYFTQNPTVDKEKIAAMVNLDMIGRLKDNNEIIVSGVGTSKEGEELIKNIINYKERDLVLSIEYNGFGPSDHAAFYIEDIPVFFFNTGPHEDYHTSRDVVEDINFDGLKRVTEYAYDLSLNIINRDSALTFQEAGPKGRARNTRAGKVRLGIMPNYGGSSEIDGLRVDGVTKGSAAERGGMKKGDIIVGIAGLEVHNIYEYMARMTKLRPGQTISVDIVRDEKKEVLVIQLDED